MNAEVAWVVELAVEPSKLSDFVSLTAETVTASQGEAGTLICERFLVEAKSRVIIYERYVDSAAAIEHLLMFKKLFGARLNDLATRQRFWLLGDVSDELRVLLGSIASVDFFPRLAGFSRIRDRNA